MQFDDDRNANGTTQFPREIDAQERRTKSTSSKQFPIQLFRGNALGQNYTAPSALVIMKIVYSIENNNKIVKIASKTMYAASVHKQNKMNVHSLLLYGTIIRHRQCGTEKLVRASEIMIKKASKAFHRYHEDSHTHASCIWNIKTVSFSFGGYAVIIERCIFLFFIIRCAKRHLILMKRH